MSLVQFAMLGQKESVNASRFLKEELCQTSVLRWLPAGCILRHHSCSNFNLVPNIQELVSFSA